MDLPPLLSGFSTASRNLSCIRRDMRLAFGYMWKTIHQIPNHLLHLILSIKGFVKNIFKKLVPVPKLGNIDLEPPVKKNLKKSEKGLLRKDHETPSKNVKDVNAVQKIDAGKTGNPVQDVKSGSLLLDDDSNFELGLMGLTHPCISNGMIQGVFEDIPEVMKELDKEIFDTAAGIVKPAQDLLKEVQGKKLVTLEDYLNAIELIELELANLTVHASQFETLPKAHSLVQITLKTLGNVTRALEEELCDKMMKQFKPNQKIGIEGDCLFEAIEDILKKRKKPKYYRELAADHIRKNAKKFKTGVLDAMASNQGKSRINTYILNEHKDVDSWKKKAEEKLGKEPSKIDLYCDCLENTNLWGGLNELIALSTILEVPILVFTKKNALKWRLDVKEGRSKFKDKTHVLLYYNGDDHYSNLIPK